MTEFLSSPVSYVAYQAAVALGSPEAPRLKEALFRDPQIVGLIQELQSWPGPSIASHKSAQQFFHKLVFLADVGVDASHPGMAPVIAAILARFDEHGIPQAPATLSPAYGGTGEPVDGWAFCDAPSTLYALTKMGGDPQRLEPGVQFLAALAGPVGFGCHVSASLGTWRGPGKKSDPCPYATLIMLKLLLLWGHRFSAQIDQSAACLLDLWENSWTKHPYIFSMGTDFRKRKLPFVWYDILHVTEVLSQVPGLRTDGRLLEMVALLRTRETEAGCVPESVYQPWKEWDFGQKKVASPWMGFCVKRIIARLEHS